MYSYDEEDDKKKINWLNLFVKVTIVVVVIILFFWIISLFNKKDSTSNIDNNITLIKNAAINYFTEDKLPIITGNSTKITLNDLYEANLLDTIKDSDGKECNATKSYITITRYNDSYNMKIYLKCSSEEKTTTIAMKKYAYCEVAICEYDSSKGSSTASSSSSSSSSTQYKYVKSAHYTAWSAFSAWQTTKVEESDTIKVETKTEKTTKKTTTTGTELETVDTKCSDGYTKSGTHCVQSTTTTDPTCGDGAIARDGFTCTYQGEEQEVETYLYDITDTKVPSNNSTYHYKNVSIAYKCVSGTCQNYFTYGVYRVSTEASTYTQDATCPTGYARNGNSCLATTISYVKPTCDDGYTLSDDKTYCYRYVDKTTDGEAKVDITYYRYATREYVEESVKYSDSKNDKDLINAGYELAE